MKGIILAAGIGTRLHPMTKAVSKQLLPIYDKPMIYYPLSVLMLAGIAEVLVITTPHDKDAFVRLLGDGSDIGIRISYGVQERPEGIAQALLIGRGFLNGEGCCLILGDNLFYGEGLPAQLRAAAKRKEGATVFLYWVDDPERYGVLSFSPDGKAETIVEKPAQSASHWAVTGLYFYDSSAVDVAMSLAPSARGELEITDVNRFYLDAGKLHAEKIGRGKVWLDTGTHDSLVEATEFVRAIESRQGLKIACLEEIAYRMGYIDRSRLRELANLLANTEYGRYLEKIADQDVS